MRIGILGGGRVGSALAETWRESGHEVTVSARGPFVYRFQPS